MSATDIEILKLVSSTKRLLSMPSSGRYMYLGHFVVVCGEGDMGGKSAMGRMWEGSPPAPCHTYMKLKHNCENT